MDITLDERELGYLRSLLRMDHRRTERKLAAVQRKFGEAWDPTGLQEKLERIEGLYRRLHPTGEPPWENGEDGDTDVRDL